MTTKKFYVPVPKKKIKDHKLKVLRLEYESSLTDAHKIAGFAAIADQIQAQANVKLL